MRRVVTTAVLAPLIAVLVAGCGDNDSDELSPSREEGTPSRTVLEIGQRVVVPGFPDILVESFRRSTDPADVSGETISYTLEAGQEFLIANIQIVNDTDSPMFIDRVINFRLLSQGEVVTDGLAMLAVLEGGLEDAELPAGREASGLVEWLASIKYVDLALLYSPVTTDGETTDPQVFIVNLEQN